MVLKNHLGAAPPSHRSECHMFPTLPTTMSYWVLWVLRVFFFFLPSVELLQVFFFFLNSWDPFDMADQN